MELLSDCLNDVLSYYLYAKYHLGYLYDGQDGPRSTPEPQLRQQKKANISSRQLLRCYYSRSVFLYVIDRDAAIHEPIPKLSFTVDRPTTEICRVCARLP